MNAEQHIMSAEKNLGSGLAALAEAEAMIAIAQLLQDIDEKQRINNQILVEMRGQMQHMR